MRVAVPARPATVRLEDRPIPRVGPGELLLKVHGCGLCGSDLAKLRGPAPGGILGHEVVGRVALVGEGVVDFREGDRVVVAHHVPCFACHYCLRGSPSMCPTFKASNLDPGGFAEFVRVPAANVRFATFSLPPSLSDEVAAFTEPTACCLRAVKRSRVQAGDTAVVLGLGSIGLLMVQLFHRNGLQVIGVEPRPERRALASRFGIIHTLGPEDPSLTEVIHGLTEGRGADLVMITVGVPSAIGTAWNLVRDGGMLHLFAGAEGEGPAPLPFSQLYHRELSVTATYSSSPAELREAFDLLCQGVLRVEELISHRLPLSRLQEGIDLLLRHEALKVFITPNGGPS